RARFDEAANIQWARRLEEAGAHVIYGVVGLKTHCKALLIVRRDTDQLRRYVHLATGNYHQRTARTYTDFGLLTSNAQLTDEVAIDLIVRGICCLRPKVPGLSDYIRVISIVGRFLEHSRIYYFENSGQPEVFLSSADWMPRNFLRRVEVAFPIETPPLRDHIINEVLPRFLNDRVKSRELQPDGSYRRLKPEGPEPRSQAQWHFREVTRERAKKLGRKKSPPADKLIPITVAPPAPKQS